MPDRGNTAGRRDSAREGSRDASAGWCEEYDHQHAVLPDGGERVPVGDDLSTQDVLDAVRSDPSLSPGEKETTLRFSAATDDATVFSAEPSITRRLLAHPYTRAERLVLLDGDARPLLNLEHYDGGREIVGVRALLPIGALQVKSEPRASDHHARVVSSRVLEEVG